MNTTAWGLVVAIPLLGIFGWLNTMAQQIIGDMHESCVATLNFVLSNERGSSIGKDNDVKKVNVDLDCCLYWAFALLVCQPAFDGGLEPCAALSTNTASTSASSDPNPPPEEPDKKR